MHIKSKAGKPLPQSLRRQEGSCVPLLCSLHHLMQGCHSSSAAVLSPYLTTQHRVISLFLSLGSRVWHLHRTASGLLRLLGDTEGMFCSRTKLQLPYTSTVQCLGSYKAVM